MPPARQRAGFGRLVDPLAEQALAEGGGARPLAGRVELGKAEAVATNMPIDTGPSRMIVFHHSPFASHRQCTSGVVRVV